MRHPIVSLVVLIAAISLFLLPLTAHHEITAKFDPAKTTRLQGVVTYVDWANPHVHIFMNVGTGNNLVNWAVELESVIDLQKAGYRRDTVKPGDMITVEGILARDNSRQVWGNSVVMTTGNRRVFNVTEEAPSRAAAGPTPRWPDGKPRLGPTSGTTGYWARPSMTILSENTSIRANKNGLLANLADIDKVAPFQRWARDLFEVRQRNRLADDPQYLYCIPPGGPRQYQEAYGVQFIEDKDHQRIFVFVGGVNHNWRLIYLDGRQQIGSLRSGDADNPLYYGRAVGKWEGDSLVVDVKGFNEKFWFSNGGLPHTEKLHLVEKFTRTDANTLKYEVTIDDTGAYTRSWSTGWNLQWIGNEELPNFFCQDNRP